MQGKKILPRIVNNKVDAAPNDDTIFPSMGEMIDKKNLKFMELEG